MKNSTRQIAVPGSVRGILSLFLLATVMLGCKKNTASTPSAQAGISYSQVNLVSDQSGVAAMTDPNLLDAWGIAVSPTGIFWISSNHGGSATVYDTTGATKIPAVTIPAPGNPTGGAPSGQVFNATTNFTISSTGKLSKFIFCTEDGTIAAWGGGTSAVIVADRSSSGTVYKGLTIATDGGANYIYAADFHNGKIDVFDSTFTYTTGRTFSDPNIPAGFAPFNIRNISGMLYVLYAKQQGPDNMDDQAGPGNGYVDIFNPNGTFVSRFASQGPLNSPWGIAVAGTEFSQGLLPILIGNFGDGRISVFKQDGTYMGQLQDSTNNPLSIDGLWDLYFPVNGVPNVTPYRLYFTAGPGGEAHGLFGYLKLR